MTILNPGVTGDGIVSMAYQRTPVSALWCIRDDGEMAVFTYERKNLITSWSRMVTDGEYESVAVIHGDDEDEVWTIVKRTIDGNDVRYVEYFSSRDFGEVNDAYFVDCGKTYTTDVNEISDLDWLEGEDVFVFADGDELKSDDVNYFNVSSGTITLGADYDTVHVGLPYTASLKTMRLSWLGEMTIQSRIEQIVEAIPRYYNSGDFYIGRDTTDKVTVEIDGMDTGDWEPDTFPLGWDRLGQVLVYQYSPEPLTILALALKFEVVE